MTVQAWEETAGENKNETQTRTHARTTETRSLWLYVGWFFR